MNELQKSLEDLIDAIKAHTESNLKLTKAVTMQTQAISDLVDSLGEGDAVEQVSPPGYLGSI